MPRRWPGPTTTRTRPRSSRSSWTPSFASSRFYAWPSARPRRTFWSSTALSQKLARLTDEQIAAAGQPSVDNACFTHIQKIVLSFVDEVIAGPQISNPVFERVRSVLTPREIVELLLVIGWYWTACRLTSALEIEPEHPLGHGVVAMLQFEQAKRSGELADAIRADASADIPPLGDLVY